MTDEPLEAFDPDAVRREGLITAAGTEPVESEELPPGRSPFSMTATLAPASWPAIAAASRSASATVRA